MSSVFATAFRILTFRATAEELRALDRRHLALGLILTWLVGMGRWWEDPRASLLQHLGIGSVVYVFALALFLWLVLWPMQPPHWSFFNLLTFVTLTSPPALLYALPVRQGLDLPTAQAVRLGFLAVVAGWRVLLLGFYLWRGAGLSGAKLIVGILLPLIVLIVTLTMLNLEKVVFDFMRGREAEHRSVNDTAYEILYLISMLSFLLFIPLLIGYLVMSIKSLWRRNSGK